MCYEVVVINKNNFEIDFKHKYNFKNKVFSNSVELAYYYNLKGRIGLGISSELNFKNKTFYGILVGPTINYRINSNFHCNLFYNNGVYDFDNKSFFSDYHLSGIEIKLRKYIGRGFGIFGKTIFSNTISSSPEFNIGYGLGIYYNSSY